MLTVPYLDHHGDETELDEAFADRFGSPLPDVVNADQQFTIVASELDPTSDRIVEFLAESYDVPINAVFFRHFSDDGRDHLARTWLLDPQPTDDKATTIAQQEPPLAWQRLLRGARSSGRHPPLVDS